MRGKCPSLAYHPDSPQPMLSIIFLLKAADDDAAAGAGMDEASVLEVDAHMCHPLARRRAAEEHQVALAQVAASDATSCFQLTIGAAGQLQAVDAAVELHGKARTVGASVRAASAAVGCAYPVRGFYVEAVVVLQLNVHAQAHRGLGQCLVVEAGSRGAAGTKPCQQTEQQEAA